MFYFLYSEKINKFASLYCAIYYKVLKFRRTASCETRMLLL
nr:MAG TPA: hypothetical protein [Caudoviricetes sp.]